MQSIRAVFRLIPPHCLPLSLVTFNGGVAWGIAAATGIPALQGAAAGIAGLVDATAVLAILLQCSYLLRCVVTFPSILAEMQRIPNMAMLCAGLMADMGLSSWCHSRGARVFGVFLWTASQIGFLLLSFTFLRKCFGLARARQLWSKAAPPFILPVVGLAAAAATGGEIVTSATSDPTLRRVALWGPLAYGGAFCVFGLPLLWAKALSIRGSLCRDPTTAILCAPMSLLLAGLLAATAAAQDSPELQANAALAHALAIGSMLTLVPVDVAMIAHTSPSRPFDLSIVVCGFPMEIAAVALLRYRAYLQATQPSLEGLRTVVEAAAWVQLVIASFVAVGVFGRYMLAAYRSIRAMQATSRTSSQQHPQASDDSSAVAVMAVPVERL